MLAVNAWAARLPEVRRSLVVTSSDVIATPPIRPVLEEIGWTWQDGPCVSDSRRLVNYYRPTRDGRVVFGKGGGLLALAGRIGAEVRRAVGPRRRRRCTTSTATTRSCADVPEVQSWCGPIDYALDGLPFLHRLPGAPEVIVAAGFSGNGVGPSHTAGRALASMALRRDDEWAATLLARAPAGQAAAGARHVVRRPGREARPAPQGGRGGPRRRRRIRSTLRLAALDPTSFVDRG